MKRVNRTVCVFVVAWLVGGCAGLYFRDAGPPPPAPGVPLHVRAPIDHWTGIVFNGAKIGFSHLRVVPAPDAPGHFDIHSEAFFRIRFLLLDKTVKLTSVDRVAGDLTLRRFAYDFDLDGNRLQLTGRVDHRRLQVTARNRDQADESVIDLPEAVYPTSVINLYPALHGLAVERTYRFTVFDGQTRRLDSVTQRISGYEESDLFPGKAFKIDTRYQQQSMTTWMDPEGRPLLEMTMGGVIIASLETEAAAKNYLVQAAMNKDETLLAFGLIRTDEPIPAPERVQELALAVSGLPPALHLADDDRQTCTASSETRICRVVARPLAAGEMVPAAAPAPEPPQRYLGASSSVTAHHPRIRGLAAEITAGHFRGVDRAAALVTWIRANIRREPVDVFTALDVLDGGRAECQGHAYLYAALARSVGLPTRIVNGIVYSADFQGFLYHSWNESLLDGQWTAVDPTFGQLPADATHLRLVEGEALSDLMPLVDLIGRIRLSVLEHRP